MTTTTSHNLPFDNYTLMDYRTTDDPSCFSRTAYLHS